MVAGIAPTLSLLAGSAGISLTPGAAGQGTLISSNSTPDGVGDAVLAFSGNVTGIDLDYIGGNGANGVYCSALTPCLPKAVNNSALLSHLSSIIRLFPNLPACHVR